MSWQDRIDRLQKERQDANLWRTRTAIGSPQSHKVIVDGQALLNFSSNDYLGLANHSGLKKAGQAAIEKWGNGSGASHLVCGHLELHDELESKLAEFVGAEKAIVFSTGYMANLAIPQTFLDRHGLLLQDKLNHASLIDAGKTCDAKLRRYPHLNAERASVMLAESNDDQKMVMTDGVFSMDGDVAPVVQLDKFCKREQALLVVDDAHGVGVLGDSGSGCLETNNIAITNNVLMMGTLGKALGGFGAFVAGDSKLIEAMLQFARTYIYTTALPPAAVGTTIAAIDLMKSESWRREKLHENIAYFRSKSESLNLGESGTAIQPILVGESEAALTLSRQLREHGFWVPAIRPPTVPAGTARLRICLSSEHSSDDIDCLLNAIKQSVVS